MNQPTSLAGVLLSWRRLLVRTTIAAAVVAVIVSLLLPKWYSAGATIMPPREGNSGGGILQLVSQLGSDLGAGTGKAARRIFGRSQTAEIMLGVLQSRRIRGEVVDQFGLVEVYDVPSREHAIRRLADHLVVDTTPESLIRVTVEDRDGQRAADMANAFLERLDVFNRQTSVDVARRTVAFIETCLEENRERRQDASAKLRDFQERNGAIQISEQTRATVAALAELETERMRLQVQSGVLENYASLDNPEFRRIGDEIREIDRAMDALRGRALPDTLDGAYSTSDGALLPLGDIPRLGLEFADLKREVLVHESVYEFLAAQYEDARIQQTRDQETIQFLDEAVPPIRRARPRRSLIVILTTILALLASAGTALAAQATLDRFEATDPETESMRDGLRPFLAFLDRLRTWGSDVPESPEPSNR